MSKTIDITVGLAQINPKVGDIKANVEKIVVNIEKAKEQGVNLVAFGELSLCGYPPEDLIYKESFLQANSDGLEEIRRSCTGITAVVGFINGEGGIFNSLAVVSNKKIIGIYNKLALPNYGVFDEKRYFDKGNEHLLINIEGYKIGLSICEDLWESGKTTKVLSSAGCSHIININASPYSRKKEKSRLELLKRRTTKNKISIGYINLVGGQDELVFDGKSLFVDEKGKVISQAKGFEEDLLVQRVLLVKKKNTVKKEKIEEIEIKIKKHKKTKTEPVFYKHSQIEDIYNTIKLGLRDYIRKNGFSKVVLGLSGGVDSALVAAIAKEALGSENVKGVMMTSPYTSQASIDDAVKLAANLKIELFDLPIQKSMESYEKSLEEVFKDQQKDITEENIQARIRGNFLMALSNKFGWIVLATGNKSEMSVGYSTLYGDLAGGIAPIKDVPKTVVYELCRYINKDEEIIPENIITKAPSAELRENQTDQDDLPGYDIIDKIIEYYIERDYGVEKIIEMGYNQADVKKITRLIDINEYKRRQAPVGIKITEKSFGKERRMPITNGFRG